MIDRPWRLAVVLAVLWSVGSLACGAPPGPTASSAPGGTPPAPAAGVAGSAGDAAAPAPSPPERRRIRVTYGTVSGSAVPLWLADEKGLFEKHGLSVEVQHAESNIGVAALVAGESQANFNEGVSVMRAISAGSPLRIVAYVNNENPYAVVARPEIRTPADLRGKAIALLRPADTTDISARIALNPRGITVGEDVQPLQAGNSPSRLAALLSGQVAAALLSEAFVDQAVSQGMHVLISLEKEKLPYISTGVNIAHAFGRDNPNTVMAFLRGVAEGTHFFAAPGNRAEVLPVVAKYLQREPGDPAVTQAYDFYHDRLARDPYPDRDSAETILQALRSIDPVAYGDLTADQVLDGSYVSAIRESGFFDRLWER